MKILRRPGCQPRAGLRSLTALTALALTLVFLAAACTRSGSVGAGGLPDIGRRPHTTVGALIFSPPRDATEVSPKRAGSRQRRGAPRQNDVTGRT